MSPSSRPDPLSGGWALCLSLLLCVTPSLGCGGHAAPSVRTAPPTGPVPVALSARDLSGAPADVAAHVGRDVVLINFWATYCEPCATEMPFLQALHQQYDDRGLRLFAVSLDGPETLGTVRAWVKDLGLTFRVLVEPDPRAVAALNPDGRAPFTVLLDRDGRVAATMDGFDLAHAGRLEAEVRHLIYGDATAAGRR